MSPRATTESWLRGLLPREARVLPIATQDYPTPARRLHYRPGRLHGANFVHYRLKDFAGERQVVLDAMTYAGNEVETLLRDERLDTIVHFAAESHVDRSNQPYHRPGHDRRYAIDSNKAERELTFKPRMSLAAGLAATFRWYVDNEDWWRNVMDGHYHNWIDVQYARDLSAQSAR